MDAVDLKPHKRCHSNENYRDASGVSFIHRRRNGNGFMHSKAGMTAVQTYILSTKYLARLFQRHLFDYVDFYD
jgi:hypothetical protein